MTPEAVIYRYLELVDPGRLDLDALLRLVSSDADLLSRWLRILQIPACSETLTERLSRLGPDELKGIADAQVWTVSPTPDSARLSLDQWQSVLRAAYLAEVLVGGLRPGGDQAPEEDGASIRMRALLALSGVHLENDSKLADLIAFRGARPDLLEDAALELRVFAVVDSLELGRDAAIASQVLGLSSDRYQAYLETADTLVAIHVEQLKLVTDPDIDWAHRIWLRQQISVATTAFQDCSSLLDMANKHTQVSRSLFTRAPLLLLQSDDLEKYELFPDQSISIGRASTSSVIAEVARSGTTKTISDDYEIAVVDRQLLQYLDCEHALVRATTSEPIAIFVVDVDDDLDVDAATEMYVDAFERHLPRSEQPTESDSANIELEAYRAQEVERLREVVHEANNPLSIVHNYLHILELRFQDDPTTAEQLQLISSELDRAGRIFTRAREVSEVVEVEMIEPSALGELDLVDWLRQVHQLQLPSLQANGVEFVFESSVATLICLVRQTELHQILTNLIKNAGEATSMGGRVTLTLEHRYFRNGVAGMQIEIADTGPGLPDDVLRNLRGQKETHKGGDHQGIGLQVVYRLVEEIGSELDLSTGENGTSFRLFIPSE